MAKSKRGVQSSAVSSVFAGLEEGEIIIFEFENDDTESQIRRGRAVFGERVMPSLLYDMYPRGRVSNADGLADLLNEVLRLLGFELRFHEAYNRDNTLNEVVTNIETGRTKLTTENEREYASVTSVHYKIHRI